MKRIPKLHSRAGVGMTAFLVLSLPLLLLLLALVINGMATVATYRRAVALATLGVQAGASSVDFGGTSPSISGNACALAIRAVCENTGGCGPGNPKARMSCGVGGNRAALSLQRYLAAGDQHHHDRDHLPDGVRHPEHAES